MAEASVGRIVHYVSRGSADGEFPATCRAAIVTSVAKVGDAVSLAVISPIGLMFDDDIQYDDDEQLPGSWHWPERVP